MILHGKTAIVTGGAGGIGHAIAERFLRDGAKVVIADVDHAKGEDAEARLSKFGDVRFVKTDVSKRLDVHNLVAATIEAFSDIDMLVNNAAVVHSASFLDLKEEDFDRVLRVNLKGSFLAGQAVARYLVEKVKKGGTPGSIVNMSSIARHGNRGQSNYSAAKAALAANTTTWMREFGQYGIRVGAVAPGMIETPMTAGMNQKARDALVQNIPVGRIGVPEDIWLAVKFVLECDYFNGRTIDVDGGLSM